MKEIPIPSNDTTGSADEPTQVDEMTAIHALFDGVLPERKDEFRELIDTYQPCFSIIDELGEDGQPDLVMDAGEYVKIRFNHRMMRVFWLSSFIVWEAYSETANTINEKRVFNPTRLNELKSALRGVLSEDDSTAAKWPENVPQPGSYDRKGVSPEVIAPAEIAAFANAWAFLHEIRHLQRQHMQTSMSSADSEGRRAEELDCDAYAARYITEHSAEHAAGDEEAGEKILMKRQLGVIVGALTIALLSKDPRKPTEDHPSAETRLRELLAKLNIPPESKSGTITITACAGLTEASGVEITPFPSLTATNSAATR